MSEPIVIERIAFTIADVKCEINLTSEIWERMDPEMVKEIRNVLIKIIKKRKSNE